MAYGGYDFKFLENSYTYEFSSNGPNGIIKKTVRFIKQKTIQNDVYYNLGLADWNESKKRYEDLSISNNQDAEKILLTIGSITLDFVSREGQVSIFFEGITRSRTRLFQINLNKYRNEIESYFDLYGFNNDLKWEKFIPHKTYKAFLIRVK